MATADAPPDPPPPDPAPPDPTPRRLGLALSGGGHRAACWGLGSLLAVVDLGANDQVVSVASVSGGSIANGVVANAVDLATCTGPELEAAVAPSLDVMASTGLFFRGDATDGYVRAVLGTAALLVALLAALLYGLVTVVVVAGGRRLSPLWGLLLGVVLAAAAAFVFLRRARAKPTQPNQWPVALAVVLVAASAMAGPFAVVTSSGPVERRGLVIVAGFVVLGLALWGVVGWFGRRSEVVDAALGRVLLSTGSAPTRLGALAGRPVHHVFCATELQSGNHCYLSPELAYTFQVGYFGDLGDLDLSTAVQASACLPGAFRPRRVDAIALGRPVRPWLDPATDPPDPAGFSHLLLNDGGVYDNMADQWEQGFTARAERLAGLGRYQDHGADFLVVVNAGKGMTWAGDRAKGSLGREIDGLSRSIDVVYDVSTAVRRKTIVDRFTMSALLDDRQREQLDALDGLLVHIGTLPSTFADQWAKGSDDRADRAQAAVRFLRDLGVDETPFLANAGVATTLGRLGVDAVADLLHHAYLLTVVGLHIFLALGPLDATDPRYRRARFVALASGQVDATTSGG